MTIISRQHARRLVRQGKATEAGILKPDGYGIRYACLTRHDIERVDHYIATAYDIDRMQELEETESWVVESAGVISLK